MYKTSPPPPYLLMVCPGCQALSGFKVEYKQDFGQGAVTLMLLARGRVSMSFGTKESLFMAMKMSFQLLLHQLHGTSMILSELWTQGSNLGVSLENFVLCCFDYLHSKKFTYSEGQRPSQRICCLKGRVS